MRALVCFLVLGCLALNVASQNFTTNTSNPSSNITSHTAVVNLPKPAKKYDPQTVLACVVIVVIFALLFDFSNGFHDTANAIATCVGTKSMCVPRIISYLPFCQAAAVNGEGKEFIRSAMTAIYAGVFNFLPVFAGSLHVANQISSVIATKNFPDGAFIPLGILCTYSTLVAALFWNFLTWQLGLPSSSSHALIGSLVGSGLAVDGIQGVSWMKVVNIVYGLLGSPVYAGVVALVCFWLLILLFKAITKAAKYEIDKDNWVMRALEVLSTGGLAWLHGANDAQKTMGIIAACLLSAGYTTTYSYVDSSGKTVTDVHIEPWVLYSCHVAIGIGTLFGGWSIVGKMALDIYPKLNRTSGFCANSGAIVSLSVATYGLPIGLPVSTTHATNCAILAAGLGESGRKAVHWKTMGHMLVCWICTIPVTMFVGFAITSLMLLPGSWSPFFCIFWGVVIIGFMLFCVFKQRTARKHTALRISRKYELHSTPSSKGKDKDLEDPAAVALVPFKPEPALPSSDEDTRSPTTENLSLSTPPHAHTHQTQPEN